MNILEIGLAKGEEIGKKRGEEIGKEIGKKIGREEGEQRVSRLIRILIEQERTEEIKNAVTDKVFQNALFDEFGI